MPAPWGRQPARVALYAAGITIEEAARECGVSHAHLRNVLCGQTRPKQAVRDRLPVLLGEPLEELFDRAVIAKPYDGSKAWGTAPPLRRRSVR